LAFATCLTLSLAARADEILFFTNGTTMPIRSHRIEKGMIHVELSAKSEMAFPSSMVDRIEQSGRAVYGTGATANQAVSNASVEANGRGAMPSRYLGVDPSEAPRGRPAPGTRQNGGGDEAPTGAAMSPVGSRLKSAMGGGPGQQPGTRLVGTHSAFSAQPPGSLAAAGPISGFGRRPGLAPPSQAAPPAAGSDNGSEAPPEAAPPEEMPDLNPPSDDDGDGDSPE
jgi:hypothetical protein